MKALIKKYPINCSKEFQNEVFWQSAWPDWVSPDGDPLTNEEYRYAMCQEAGIFDEEVTADDFVVTEHEIVSSVSKSNI